MQRFKKKMRSLASVLKMLGSKPQEILHSLHGIEAKTGVRGCLESLSPNRRHTELAKRFFHSILLKNSNKLSEPPNSWQTVP